MNKRITIERKLQKPNRGSLCKGCIFSKFSGHCAAPHAKIFFCHINGKDYIWKQIKTKQVK